MSCLYDIFFISIFFKLILYLSYKCNGNVEFQNQNLFLAFKRNQQFRFITTWMIIFYMWAGFKEDCFSGSRTIYSCQYQILHGHFYGLSYFFYSEILKVSQNYWFFTIISTKTFLYNSPLTKTHMLFVFVHSYDFFKKDGIHFNASRLLG